MAIISTAGGLKADRKPSDRGPLQAKTAFASRNGDDGPAALSRCASPARQGKVQLDIARQVVMAVAIDHGLVSVGRQSGRHGTASARPEADDAPCPFEGDRQFEVGAGCPMAWDTGFRQTASVPSQHVKAPLKYLTGAGAPRLGSR